MAQQFEFSLFAQCELSLWLHCSMGVPWHASASHSWASICITLRYTSAPAHGCSRSFRSFCCKGVGELLHVTSSGTYMDAASGGIPHLTFDGNADLWVALSALIDQSRCPSNLFLHCSLGIPIHFPICGAIALALWPCMYVVPLPQRIFFIQDKARGKLYRAGITISCPQPPIYSNSHKF